MSSPVYDVVIIGGGIVGAACAAECASEGLRVAIVEAKMIGGGATAAGMGHLTVMDDSEAQFALTRYSQLLWEGLRDELPLEVEYDACGTIWVAADDEEMREVSRKQDFYTQRGVAVEVLDAQSLAEAIPPVAVRLRRDFGQLLGLIRSHAILHQATRDRDAAGRIIATLEDYEVVRSLVVDLIAEGID